MIAPDDGTPPPGGEKGAIMRPPKQLVITDEQYHSTYWPQIRDCLMHMLTNPNELQFPTEECYRMVYNVCCQRHQVALYNDMLNFVTSYLQEVRAALAAATDPNFLATLTAHFIQFKRSCEVIGVTFRYLDRMYIIEKLSSSITTLLLTTRNKMIFDTPEMKARIQSQLQPFNGIYEPSMVMHLVKSLYGVSKEFVALNPRLFALFIPVLFPSRGIENDVREINDYLAKAREHGLFNDQQSRGEAKRKWEDAISN